MARGFDLKAAVWSGLIAGLVFMMLEMVLVGTVGGGSPWAPPRMVAAIGLGKDVLPPPATFDPGVMAAAMMIHFVLSAILGIVFALIVSRWASGTGAALIAGALFGLVVYLVAFYGFTSVFPWFAMARNWMSVVSHLMFGAVLGWTYHKLARSADPARV